MPDLLGIPPNQLSALFFRRQVLLIRYAAGLWVSLRGNHWLTFGIKLGGMPPHRG